MPSKKTLMIIMLIVLIQKQINELNRHISKQVQHRINRRGGRIAKVKLKADREKGIIILDTDTSLHGVPPFAQQYKLGNRSAIEWVLDQYKEKKPRDKTIAEKFNNYRFADYKEDVIELIQRVCTVSIETMKIIERMNR